MSFGKTVEISKCTSCPIANSKKKLLDIKFDHSIIWQQGTGKDILFILEMIEYEKEFESFKKFLSEMHIDNYTIALGLNCRSKKFEIPSPAYKIYRHCNCLGKFDFEPYKVIVTLGRAIMALTQSDDIIDWSEFEEYVFNQTYFYYKEKRVYPFPIIPFFVGKDNFENHFVKKQILFIKTYLRDYEIENLKDKFQPFNVIKVDDPNAFLLEHMSDPFVSFDFETNSLDTFRNDFKIACLTLSFDEQNGYFLPFDKINKRILTKFFDVKREYLSANGKYDMHAGYKAGVKNIVITEDVTLSFHLFNTDRRKNSIKSLAWLIGLGGYDKELDLYKEKNKITDYTNIPESLLIKYSVVDAILVFRLWKLSLEMAKVQPLVYKNYKEVIIPVIPVFFEMELEGMKLNSIELNKLNESIDIEKKIVEKEIQSVIGDTQINSNQKLAIALEKFGLPDLGRSEKQFYLDNGEKKYFYKTGIDVLSVWKRMGYEIADKLIKYRELEKKQTSFVGEIREKEENLLFNNFDVSEEGLVKFIRDDGKLHSIYSPGRTDAYRSSCQSPNTQNYIKEKWYRKIFDRDDNNLWFELDMSGFHLRIMGVYSRDEEMLKIFRTHGDMHSTTTLNIFFRGMSFDEFLENKKKEPYKKYRDNGKCFSSNVLVKTNKGYIPIDNIVLKDNLNNFTKYDGDYKVYNRNNVEVDILETYYGESKEFIKLYMDNGEEIEVTPYHKFPVIRDGKELVIEADSLEEGDEFINIK